jgi:hypothetical protein
MEPAHLIRTSLWLLASAAAFGLVMAVIRFAKDVGPPALLSKVHGMLTCSAIAILSYGWATVGLPKLACVALVLLLVTASAGLATSQGWRWMQPSNIQLVLFAHLSMAAAGFFLLLAASAA